MKSNMIAISVFVLLAAIIVPIFADGSIDTTGTSYPGYIYLLSDDGTTINGVIEIVFWYRVEPDGDPETDYLYTFEVTKITGTINSRVQVGDIIYCQYVILEGIADRGYGSKGMQLHAKDFNLHLKATEGRIRTNTAFHYGWKHSTALPGGRPGGWNQHLSEGRMYGVHVNAELVWW